jgi:phosphatidylserine decarboxylase
MVRDGIFYGIGLLAAAGVVWFFASPWLALIPLLLAIFCMWFFRDPERTIPAEPNAIVAPADGKITHIVPANFGGKQGTRISIFLNVFDVHVNRAPIQGIIRSVDYKKGCFGNAMDPVCADQNEQNVVMLEGEGHLVIFKQIAGLIARRIVFTKKAGDGVARGQRVGMIKFGSRTDLILPSDIQLAVRVGDHVKGGSSVLAHFTAGQGGS